MKSAHRTATVQRALRTGTPPWRRRGGGESANGLPFIGAIPGAPNCYAVLGYGGHGVSFSVIAAQVIQRAILGQPDPDADQFALPS